MSRMFQSFFTILLLGLTPFIGLPQNAKLLTLRVGYVNSTAHGSLATYLANVPNPPAQINSIQAFEISALTIIKLNKLLCLNTGMGFIQKGGILPYQLSSSSINPFDVTLNYLTLPVLLSGNLIGKDRLSAGATAGLTANIEMSSEQYYPTSPPGEEDPNKLVLSFSVGGFLRYRINESLALQGEFQYFDDITPFYRRMIDEEWYVMKSKGQIYSLGIVSDISKKPSEQSDKEISVSFQAGFVQSGLWGSFVEFNSKRPFTDGYYPVKNKSGFEILTTVRYELCRPLGIYTGVGFIQKGGAIENTGNLYPVDVTLNYLQIPIGIVLSPIVERSFSLSLSIGVVNNFELSSDQDFLTGLGGENKESNTFILSYSVGGAFQYSLNEQFALQGEARWVDDFTPFFEWDNNSEHQKMKTRSQVYSLGVVYKLRRKN